MHRYMLHNGKIVDAGTSDLSPGQVGLLNGWGVFSTIRVYNGVMFAWERHWNRMATDAARLRIPFPESSSAIEQDLYRLLAANENANTVVRITIIRNRGGLWQGPQPTSDYDVLAYTRGITNWNPAARLDLVPHARHAASPFAGAKYLSWAENLTLNERAHDKGLDDALLLNERGEVSECTSCNLFAVNGTRVLTPPIASGCLPGITRALLLEEIHVDGIEVRERRLLPADLEAADELFVTSSTRELIPVEYVEGLQIRYATDIRDRLQAAFSSYVDAYVAASSVAPTTGG